MSEIGSCSRPYGTIVGANVGAIVETASQSADRVLLLGPLRVIQNGAELALPPSRKVRALLAYLAMASRPVTREKLCELLWDIADNPRSELRWCLAKLRPLIDAPTTSRLIADRERVGINTSSLDVDAISVARSAQMALASGSSRDLQSLRALYHGGFLEGLSIDRAPLFDNWLAGQRHRFGQLRQQLLERLSAVLPPDSDDRIEVLRERIEVEPFDEAAHIELIGTLLRRGLHAQAGHQIDGSVARFQSEGIEPTSLKSAVAVALRSASKPARMNLVGVARPDAPSGRVGVHPRRPTLPVLPFTAATPEDVRDADGGTCHAKRRAVHGPSGSAMPLPTETAAVHVIDDDAAMRDALEGLFQSVGIETRTYASAGAFLAARLVDKPGCIVIDVRLPDMNGLDFHARLIQLGIRLPVVMITGYGDIPMSVRAMKRGAVDFLAKPIRDQDMLDAVTAAIERDRRRRTVDGEVLQIRQRFGTLSRREQQVMLLVTAGEMNKQIAGDLGISEITVKLHRGAAMRKMGARTIADLVRMAEMVKSTQP